MPLLSYRVLTFHKSTYPFMAFVYSYGKKQFKSHVFGIRELTISHVKYVRANHPTWVAIQQNWWRHSESTQLSHVRVRVNVHLNLPTMDFFRSWELYHWTAFSDTNLTSDLDPKLLKNEGCLLRRCAVPCKSMRWNRKQPLRHTAGANFRRHAFSALV